MGMRMLSMKEADKDAFHMSFFILSTTIFAREEIGSGNLTPKKNVLRR
jgi:hypothetical protein